MEHRQLGNTRELASRALTLPSMTLTPFYQAIQAHVAQQALAAASRGQLLTLKQKRQRAELEMLLQGIPDGVPLTPLQQKIRDSVDGTEQAFRALLVSLDRDPDAVDDPVAAALAGLVGPLVGRLLALQTRVEALEASAG